MAILEKVTGYYYRIDEENSFKQKGSYFIGLIIYNSERHRQNERARSSEFDIFNKKIDERILSLEKEGNSEQLILDLGEASILINKALYTCDISILPNFSFSTSLLSELINCGYKTEWTSEPIVILGRTIVNIGDTLYDCEGGDMSILYNSLKTSMSEAIDNV